MAEIVCYIHEFITRRLFLDHGCTSTFGYLVDKLGYSRATAQNRIDAARLFDVIPEIKDDLASGQINLGQITQMSMGIRQAEKENPGMKVSDEQKRDIVKKLKETNKPQETSQRCSREEASLQIVTRELDIKVNRAENVRIHQDGSVTIEVYLSKEEFENLKRVRELASHKNHDAKLGETVSEATKFYLEKKDPRKVKMRAKAPRPSSKPNLSDDTKQPSSSSNFDSLGKSASLRKHISIHVVRAIHQRDQSCRWVDPATGHVCGSTYQLEIDHIDGLAEGGTNDVENLELKCDVHNRRKFELEQRGFAIQ